MIPNLLNARKNANTTAAQAYVRNVATAVEADRNPTTGALPTLGQCTTFVANPPASVKDCNVTANTDGVNFTVTANLQGARYDTINFDSSTGQFSFNNTTNNNNNTNNTNP